MIAAEDAIMAFATGDVALAASRINRATIDIEQRHTLPGLLLDLTAAVERLFELAERADPDIDRAYGAGLRSTRDLPAPELIDFTLEAAA